MSDFRCKTCNQLQFKHRLIGDKLIIEIKCYNDNTYNYFTVQLSSLLKNLKNEKYEKNNQQK